MRRTDFCHPIRITCTRTPSVPNSLRWLPSAEVPRRLRLRTTRLGDRVFHDTRDRFGSITPACLPRALFPRGLETRAWAFSSHDTQLIEPLTPLSQSPFHPQRFVELPRRCLLLCLRRPPAFLQVGADRRMRRPPRPPSTPSRESRRLVLIWDAFYRQGTLRRCRWPLQPRSRDRHTVFCTMGRPLNGTLAPPWVFVRSSPVRSGMRPASDVPFARRTRRWFHPPTFASS